MLELLTDPQTWASILTLTALEIVLGIDNIIFISILTGRLPADQQARARTIGLGLAMGMRIAISPSRTANPVSPAAIPVMRAPLSDGPEG